MFFTIEEQDVGKLIIKRGGERIWVTDLMGQVLPIDIGKRVYFVNGIWQVENQEQLETRLGQK